MAVAEGEQMLLAVEVDVLAVGGDGWIAASMELEL